MQEERQRHAEEEPPAGPVAEPEGPAAPQAASLAERFWHFLRTLCLVLLACVLAAARAMQRAVAALTDSEQHY